MNLYAHTLGHVSKCYTHTVTVLLLKTKPLFRRLVLVPPFDLDHEGLGLQLPVIRPQNHPVSSGKSILHHENQEDLFRRAGSQKDEVQQSAIDREAAQMQFSSGVGGNDTVRILSKRPDIALPDADRFIRSIADVGLDIDISLLRHLTMGHIQSRSRKGRGA